MGRAEIRLKAIFLDDRLEDRRLWVDQLTAILAPGGQINTDGWVDMNRSLDLRFAATGISTNRIMYIEEVLPGSGLMNLAISAKVNMMNPTVAGRMNIDDIVFNGEPMKDIDLTFSIADMQAELSGDLDFDVDAKWNLKTGEANCWLKFNDTQTAGYFRAMGKPEWHGSLTGLVAAKVNIRDLSNMSAYVDLKNLNLKYRRNSLPVLRCHKIVAKELEINKSSVVGLM